MFIMRKFIIILACLCCLSACSKKNDAHQPLENAQNPTADAPQINTETEKTLTIAPSNDQPNQDVKEPSPAKSKTELFSEIEKLTFPGIPESPAANIDWSGIRIHVQNDNPDNPNKERIIREITPILQQWNALRNAHDSQKLAKLYADESFVRGTSYNKNDFIKKMNSSLYIELLNTKQNPEDASIRAITFSDGKGLWGDSNPTYGTTNYTPEYFNENFIQSKKSTDTEIYIVLQRYLSDDDQSDWKIYIESDIETDRNIIAKLGITANPHIPGSDPLPCEALKCRIITESPLYRLIAATNYEAFSKAEDVKMKFSCDEGFHLYEEHDDHNVTIAWFDIDLDRHSISSSTYNDTEMRIDSRFDGAINKYCAEELAQLRHE